MLTPLVVIVYEPGLTPANKMLALALHTVVDTSVKLPDTTRPLLPANVTVPALTVRFRHGFAAPMVTV
jgi:hypothetical protein